MDKLKLATLAAVTLAAFSFAPVAFAEGDGGGCVTDCDPEPEPTQKGNNGLGNGDQTAPGGSLANNKAENQVGNPGHASGQAQNSN